MTLIIPDIHADIERLNTALAHAGDEPIAFLGDFIDQGPWSKSPASDGQVLETVRNLIEDGRAVAVMGNHELNAVLFHRMGVDGLPLRKHSDKNIAQHQSFIDEFGVATAEALAWTEWFLTALPLWYEGDGFRLVHACWSEPDIAIIKARRPDGFLKIDDLAEIAEESTPFGIAVKRITSGPEVTLPEGYGLIDSKGFARREVRLRWWGNEKTWRNSALSVPDLSSLPDGELPIDLIFHTYPDDAPPVFIGHYKMRGNPKLENDKVICLDYPYSACAYRWMGEAKLDRGNLIDATRLKLVAPTPPMGSTDGPIGLHLVKVVFRVPVTERAVVKEKLGIEPEPEELASKDLTFIWEVPMKRLGDDEGVQDMLRRYLDWDVAPHIDWELSKY